MDVKECMDMYKIVALDVNFLCGFKLLESCGADIEKVVRKGDVLALEIGNNPECSDGSVKYRTVEFAKNVCSSGIARYNNKWTGVAWFHFCFE